MSRGVRDGLKVVVFEQTAEVLEKRLGFRTAEYGLRELFHRNADHPLLAGLTDEAFETGAGSRRFCRRDSPTRCDPAMDRLSPGAIFPSPGCGPAAIKAT